MYMVQLQSCTCDWTGAEHIVLAATYMSKLASVLDLVWLTCMTVQQHITAELMTLQDFVQAVYYQSKAGRPT